MEGFERGEQADVCEFLLEFLELINTKQKSFAELNDMVEQPKQMRFFFEFNHFDANLLAQEALAQVSCYLRNDLPCPEGMREGQFLDFVTFDDNANCPL